MTQFSILTPSFGYGRFIEDCVRSVLEQRWTDVEHIVIDGASSDDTVAKLASLSNDRRLRWQSEPDEGQSHALIKAFRRSHGEWIGWLNADEFYLPRTLETVAAAIDETPNADVFYGDFVEVDHAGRLMRLVAEHRPSRAALRARCYIASCTIFIRRRAMPARLWDRKCYSMMDWDLFLAMQGAGRSFSHIPRALAAFRVHEGQVTGSSFAQQPDEFDLIRQRHGIPAGGLSLTAVRVAGRAAHIARKAVEGGYVREVRAARHAGGNLRWFGPHEPLAQGL